MQKQIMLKLPEFAVQEAVASQEKTPEMRISRCERWGNANTLSKELNRSFQMRGLALVNLFLPVPLEGSLATGVSVIIRRKKVRVGRDWFILDSLQEWLNESR